MCRDECGMGEECCKTPRRLGCDKCDRTFSGANGATSRFSLKEVNTDEETVTGNDGWGDKGFETVTWVCALTFEVVMEACGRKA